MKKAETCNPKEAFELKSGTIVVRFLPYETWYVREGKNFIIAEKGSVKIAFTKTSFNEKFTLRGD